MIDRAIVHSGISTNVQRISTSQKPNILHLQPLFSSPHQPPVILVSELWEGKKRGMNLAARARSLADLS